MAGKDKRQRRNEKKFAELEAQFTKLNAKSPAHGPARSPAHVPVKLSHLAPSGIEELPPNVLGLVAAFTGPTLKDALKTLSTVSRLTYLTVEAHRYSHAAPTEAVALDVVAKTSQRRAAPIELSASSPNTLVAVENTGDVDLIHRVAIAVLRHGRSALHGVGRSSDAMSAEWIVHTVASNKLPLGYKQPGSGRTLLHVALWVGDSHLALKLIKAAVASKAGFDPWIVDDLKRSALHVAAAEGLSDCALAVLRYVEPNRMEAYGALVDLNRRTAVEEATHCRHTKLATSLVAAIKAAQQYGDDEEDDDAEYYEDDDGTY